MVHVVVVAVAVVVMVCFGSGCFFDAPCVEAGARVGRTAAGDTPAPSWVFLLYLFFGGLSVLEIPFVIPACSLTSCIAVRLCVKKIKNGSFHFLLRWQLFALKCFGQVSIKCLRRAKINEGRKKVAIVDSTVSHTQRIKH